MMLIDSHTHLNAIQFNDDRDILYSNLQKSQIAVINIGTDLEDSKFAVALAEQYTFSFATVGLHPEFAWSKEFDDSHFLELLKNPKVVAIGETGLDYHWLPGDENDIKYIELQKELFRKHITFAIQANLPLVIHGRSRAKNHPLFTMVSDAYDDIYSILLEYKDQLKGGSLHCFGGSLEQAQQFVDLGFAIGITGIVTFQNASDLRKIVKDLSLSSLLIETDAPYLSPVPFRGKRNSPEYLPYILQEIANIRGLSLEECKAKIYQNTMDIFHIHPIFD